MIEIVIWIIALAAVVFFGVWVVRSSQDQPGPSQGAAAYMAFFVWVIGGLIWLITLLARVALAWVGS